MNIEGVVAKLQEEKQQQIPARFHCRAVMVDNVAQYSQLLELLKKISDIELVPVDELFSSVDVMPNYENLTEEKFQDRWLILPGVSEYLRLFHNNEESAQRFGGLWHHQWNARTTGRIIIPLWGCKNLWFDAALRLCDDIRQNEYVYDCTVADEETEKFKIQALSGDFEQYVHKLGANSLQVLYGLKEWYSYWYDPPRVTADQLLLTKRCRSIRATDGKVKIHVVRDMLSFLREGLSDGTKLSADNCPDEAQTCLFDEALNGKSVDQAILSVLNANEFIPDDMMGKWSTLSDGQKQLVVLWYELYPDDTYLCHCVGLSTNIKEIENQILMSIFQTKNNHPEWIRSSQRLIEAASIQKTAEYFEQLNQIPSFEERLEYLTAESPRERIYILHMVGQWLRINPDEVLSNQRLKKLYPELSAYLDDQYPDEMLKHYFARYKAYKLSNTLPQDTETYFEGVSTEEYDLRYPALSSEVDEDTIVLWIDALGAEWMPLLAWALQNSEECILDSVKVTQAQLPSETCYNDQWHQMQMPYQKLDKLDKLAHKGVVDDKDYYACVEEQISFVCSIVGKVEELLKQYHRVLITGDHGTSRLAARFFHRSAGIPVPKLAEVGSHGRFCKLEGEAPVTMLNLKTVKCGTNEKYLVYSNYDHFIQSGFAAGADDDLPIFGEIHGGASPEEMLVPVFSVHGCREIPLKARWMMPDRSVKIKMKRATCSIEFSRAVNEVQAQIGEAEGVCTASVNPSKVWNITFSKIKPMASCNVNVIADGKLVSLEPIEIKSALGGGNDPF